MTHRSFPRVLLALVLLGGLALSLSPQPVGAVWHLVLTEHFAASPLNWPWGNWSITPTGPYSWGVQNAYFKYMGMDSQSLWCVGHPMSLDPLYNPYPAGTNAWVKWGPINLSNAVAAQATFWYLAKTQPVQDYVRWGANNSSAWAMYEFDRASGDNGDTWMNSIVNFDSLAGGTISLLDSSTVYLEFQFVANWDNELGVGAFIDEINIAWDDGLLDLEAKTPIITGMDSSIIMYPFIGDSVYLALTWTASGSGTTRMFDITCDLDGEPYYIERRNVVIGSSMTVWLTTYSTPWVVDADTHTVSWMLDASLEIVEFSDDNNDTSLTFFGTPPNDPPWIQVTRPVWDDSATTAFNITWQDSDANDNATITLYWDNDSLGFNGNLIPGASYLPEDDTTNTFPWNVTTMLEGPVWVLAYIYDGQDAMWDYSDGPLYIYHLQPPNVPPTITILHPTYGDNTAANSFQITWQDEDPDDNALINLFWDNDSLEFNGTSIPNGVNILENNILDNIVWDISSFSNGAYWVYASIADDDTTVWSYSNGPLLIDRTGMITPYQPGSIPGQFTLESIYPNPFNNATTIRLGLPHAEEIAVNIYDYLGRLCAAPFTGRLQAGYFELSWSPERLPSGIYIVEIKAPGFLQRAKAVFLK